MIGGVWNAGYNATDTYGELKRRQVKIGFMSGNPSTTAVTLLVASLSSSDVTANINGTDYVISLSAANTGTAVFYVGHKRVTGLTANTRYRVKLTQGANVERDCATWTAPAAGTNFRLYFQSCDNPNVYATNRLVIDGNFTFPVNINGCGGWEKIARYSMSGAKPCYLLFCDDLCYASRAAISSTEVSATGIPGYWLNSTHCTEFNYAVAWANFFGLLGFSTDDAVLWGQSVWRLNALRSMPTLPQWGDWDFADDIGWDDQENQGSGVGTPALTNIRFTTGRSVWDKIFPPTGANQFMPPTAQNRDTVARPWAITLGDVRVVSPDGITRSTGNYSNYRDVSGFIFYPNGAPGTDFITEIYGNNQIDDVLDALNTSDKFKLLLMEKGVRYHKETFIEESDEWLSGQQHPLESHNLPEFQRLYTRTGATPKSLMDNPATNGTTGIAISWHGDTHHGAVYSNVKAAYTGNAVENWDCWFGGSNNSEWHGNNSMETIAATTVLYQQPQVAGRWWHVLYADVQGTATPKRFDCRLYDYADTLAYSKDYNAP